MNEIHDDTKKKDNELHVTQLKNYHLFI